MKIDIPSFDAARVLVVGDLMLDRYWQGDTARISPEAPVPVVHVQRQEDRPGGAGNVALNIAALGAQVRLLGFTGDDHEARVLAQRLAAAEVRFSGEKLSGIATITKLRVLSRHQQLIRLDFEQGYGQIDSAPLLHRFDAALPDCDVVLLSDYGKGTLRDVQQFIHRARADGKKVLVDPKGSDFSRYRGATLLTPNLSEFEAVVGRCDTESGLVEKARAMADELELDALLITRGEHGMTLVQPDQPVLHLPTRAREVFDVTGAGDTVIALLAAASAVGQSLGQATALANLAAGISVGKLGAATVSVAELMRGLHDEQELGTGVLNADQLSEAIQVARARGETIVMTNGCFDILHAGHVTYLQQARALGDRLIVAVNTDASVRKLKGAGRPVNSLERRMAVLAALGCVDWVVAFDEDTPQQLICALAPDILVKGGDNDPAKIPGGDCVRARGGEVRVLDYLSDVSTTKLIAAIRDAEP